MLICHKLLVHFTDPKISSGPLLYVNKWKYKIPSSVFFFQNSIFLQRIQVLFIFIRNRLPSLSGTLVDKYIIQAFQKFPPPKKKRNCLNKKYLLLARIRNEITAWSFICVVLWLPSYEKPHPSPSPPDGHPTFHFSILKISHQ